MKHKGILSQARKLIDERELDEDNLDTAYGELLDLTEEDPECDQAYGLLAEIYYWIGETADPEDKMVNYEEGVAWGEKGVAVNADSIESNFWLAVNYGSFGQEKGIMKSLSLVTPIREAAERVIGLDESFFYGGPWRVLGRLYHKAPGFPFSIGNATRARECLEKALEFGPTFYLNHLFLAELHITNWENAKAREHLEWILGAPLSKNHEREDEGYKRDAEALLARL